MTVFSFFVVVTIFEQSIGVKVNEIIVEKKTAPIIVIASSLKSFAVSPSKKIIGMKILIKTIDVEIIANITSFEPDMAACNFDDPDSIFLWIFSNITIESSITNPVHKTRANKVIRFIVYPNIFKKINVDKIEIGTVKNGIIVDLIFLRKIKIITVTKIIAKHNVNITSFKASDTKSEVS